MCIATSSSISVLSKACSITDQIVPTCPVGTAPQQLDITDLTSSDLARLKKDDPFMYYSIPSVKNAALHCRDVSPTAFLSPLSQGNSSPKQVVTRQSRLSMECHADLLLEEMTFSRSDLLKNSTTQDDGDDLYDFLLTLGEK